MEVLWKTVTGLLNGNLVIEIGFKYTLHGFNVGGDTGTASPKYQLLQELIEMRKAVLYKKFMDLQKA